MRLNLKQIQQVKDTVADYFGKDACVWVFGSRVDDQRHGGGYDFYIETSQADPDETVTNKLKMLADLHASPGFEGKNLTWSYVQHCQGRSCQSTR